MTRARAGKRLRRKAKGMMKENFVGWGSKSKRRQQWRVSRKTRTHHKGKVKKMKRLLE